MGIWLKFDKFEKKNVLGEGPKNLKHGVLFREHKRANQGRDDTDGHGGRVVLFLNRVGPFWHMKLMNEKHNIFTITMVRTTKLERSSW